MSITQCEAILRSAGIFRRLDERLLGLLVDRAVTRRFDAGERIFSQGDECPGLFVVGSGLVRVYQLSPAGKEHVLHFAEPGRTFAEVAVLGGFDCPAHADALEASECAMIPTHLLRALLRENHDLCFQLLAGMGLWVRQLVGLIEDLVLRDALGRVAGYLLRSAPAASAPDAFFELPMRRKDLASHLNLTSETLSRTLRRLEEADLIAFDTQTRLRLPQRAALQDVADGLPPAEFVGP